jgi:hypothetical protein
VKTGFSVARLVYLLGFGYISDVKIRLMLSG